MKAVDVAKQYGLDVKEFKTYLRRIGALQSQGILEETIKESDKIEQYVAEFKQYETVLRHREEIEEDTKIKIAMEKGEFE